MFMLACVLGATLAACTRQDAEYVPLETGRRWDYQLDVKILDEVQRSRIRVRNVGAVEYGGREVAVVEYPGNARGYYAETPEGVVRVGSARGVDGKVSTDPGHHFILRAPIEPGTSWTLPTELRLIESIFFESGERIRDRRVPLTLVYTIMRTDASVSVPAGTFEHCVEVHAVGCAVVRVNQGANFGHVDVIHTDWYAPGVGLVKSQRRETSDSPYLKSGEYRQELVSME